MFLMSRIWLRFSELQLCHNHIYIIDIVKFSNRYIPKLVNLDSGTCMNFANCYIFRDQTV